MKHKSLDFSMMITKDDDVQQKFNMLMGDFLSRLPSRIDFLPATIILSVETGDDFWNFVADIECHPSGVMEEIIINFPTPANGIKLVDVEELQRYYKSIGKSVPYQYVILPYARILGRMFVVLPFSPKDEDAAQ